jgi:hypothetical protein
MTPRTKEIAQNFWYLFHGGAGYGWIGHKPGSGFSDLAPAILHYNWF